MFTAENWRTFLRLRLVPPICSMTKFYTNFYYIGNPILHYFWELPLARFIYMFDFFVLRVTYLHHGFFNGLFVITLLSSGWIVRNWSRVLLRNSSKSGHMPRSRGCFLVYGNRGFA